MNLTDVRAEPRATRPARRKPVDRSPDPRREVRLFGVVMLGGFGLAGGLLWWLHRPTTAWTLWAIGAAVGLFALAAPRAARPLYRGWMAVAHFLGRINTAILLTLVYSVMIVPIGLVFRLFGRDALKLRKRGDATSYWESKPQPADRRSYFNQY